MFKTMTVTKAAGALIGSLLFLLSVHWLASAFYKVGPADTHYTEAQEGPKQAYYIDVPEPSAGADQAPEPIDFAALMASADPAKGERQWSKCRACHKLDGTDGVGPHLNGVVGRNVASIDGFNYSQAMRDHANEDPVWTPEAIQHFIENPRQAVSGTIMNFAGLRDAQDRADLIAYLEQNS